MSKRSIRLYLTAELLLLIAAKAADLAAAPAWTVGAVEFAAILLNAGAAFFYYRRTGRDRAAAREDLVAYALFVTLAGDVFLTLIGTEDVFVPGILLFCVTEVLYAVYLGPCAWSVGLQIFLSAAGIFALSRSGDLTWASALGAVDLALLLANMIVSWTRARDAVPLLFQIGLTLFFFCDSFIALRFVTSGGLQTAVNFMIWVFYAPSQAAITLSYVQTSKKQGR